MKHICYLTGIYSRRDSLIFERQGKSLAESGWKVTLVVCDDGENEYIHGIQILSCNYKPSSRMKRMLKTKRYLFQKALEIHADIYQISEPELLPLGIKLKNKGYKIIFNLREYYPDIVLDKAYLPKIIRHSIAWSLEKYMRVSLRKYNAVFTVTDDIADRLESWGIKKNVVTNFPIVSSQFVLSKEEYMSRKDVLGYLGTIYWISCQEEVFEALEQLPNIEYRLSGVIEEGYEKMLNKQPYWKKAKFTGRFTKNEMSSLFSAMTISNTLRDFSKMGTPNGSWGVLKIFESMEAGLPVLFSDVQLYRHLVAKYKCGICVDPHDSKQIKNAIKYLMDNKELAYQMGQNGRRAILEEYNWGNQAKIYIKILKSI